MVVSHSNVGHTVFDDMLSVIPPKLYFPKDTGDDAAERAMRKKGFWKAQADKDAKLEKKELRRLKQLAKVRQVSSDDAAAAFDDDAKR